MMMMTTTISASNRLPHNRCSNISSLPIICHCRGCKALVVVGPIHVSSAVLVDQNSTLTSLSGGRVLLALSMFLAYVAVYSQRSHLGITLIAMLNSTFVVHHQYHRQQQQDAEMNLTRRRADCKPFPRRNNDVSIANIT